MLAKIGIWLGDSFAEISAMTGEKPGAPISSASASTTRWLHSKKPLADVLRETLLNIQSSDQKAGGEIRIATSRAEMSVSRRQGSEPISLVTSGFETWAKLGLRTPASTPTLRTSRDWHPTSPDKTFGIDERVRADGNVERPLKIEELEALVAKLELLKMKEIAISFLHADRYPAHEIAAAEFFRARGYSVITSHSIPGADHLPDVERVRRTVESAFAEPVIQEDLAGLRAVLNEDEWAGKWTLRFWTPSGLSEQSSAAFVRSGVEKALTDAIPKDTELAYFFGLEEFLGFRRSKTGSLESYLLPVQPTGQIAASVWAFPSWTNVDRGYEPGPMLFGKSHQLTLLDVLFVRDQLKGDIEAFSDRVQTKSSPRILEALHTLGKNLAEPGRRAADSKDMAEDLETAFIERLSMDLSFNLKTSKRVFVAGPLASSLLPLLERRRSDLKFVVDANLSVSTAALGGTN